MTIRTSTTTVMFTRPFVLTAAGEQPAGTYVIETDEERLPTSLPAYRRISTLIRLPAGRSGARGAEVVEVDPAELMALLATDAEAAETTPDPGRAPSVTPRAVKDGIMRRAIGNWYEWIAVNVGGLSGAALVIGGALVAAFYAGR